MINLVPGKVKTIRHLTSGIEDGISDSVGELLYKLARGVPEGQAIVEIGRGKGKSTLCLVRGSEAGRKNKVFSFASTQEGPDQGKVDSNIDLAEAGIQDILISRHETAEDAARGWKENIGLLWINTSSEYEDIKRIILAWQRHLPPGARVIIHGCDQPGIGRFIKESIGSLGDFTYEQSADNTTVLTIDRCIHHWIIDSAELGICKHCGRQRNFKRMTREATVPRTRKRGS